MEGSSISGMVFLSAVTPTELQISLWPPADLPVLPPIKGLNRTLAEPLEKQLGRMSKKLSKRDHLVELTVLDCQGHHVPSNQPAHLGWHAAHAVQITVGGELLAQLAVHWNPPTCTRVRCADSLLPGVPAAPFDITLLHCAEGDCMWLWERQSQESDDAWEHAGTGYIYTPQQTDVGCYLRVICQPPAPGLLTASPSCKKPVGEPPLSPWSDYPKAAAAPVLRILSYNVLAAAYTGPKQVDTMFSYCSAQCLDPGRRRQLVVRDLIELGGDIIGLQECDQGQLNILRAFDTHELFYTKKRGEAPDGCALLWRADRFSCCGEPFVLQLSGTMEQLGLLEGPLADFVRGSPIETVLSHVTTVAHGMVLRDMACNDRKILVVNTHLFYHPDANHIRLVQLHLLLTQIEQRVKRLEDGGDSIGVLVLGDFNARKGDIGCHGIPP